MRLSDVMTTDVVSVTPDTPLKEVAKLMLEHRISGVPVVDGTRVLGVVSETDILFKERSLPERQGLVDWVLHYGQDPPAAKLEARTAGDAMTTPAVTVSPRRSTSDAATLMLELGIDRLPLVDGDELVGIVTRSDLVRAFIRTDEEITDEIRYEILLRKLWASPHSVSITVENGEVVLEGEVETPAIAEMLESFARLVPGVINVESRLHWPQPDPVPVLTRM